MEDTKTFCQFLKEKTRRAHDESDKLVNLKLAIALTDTSLYGRTLLEFYHVYMTLENAMIECKDHPLVAPIIIRDLFRTDAFERDLEFYLGSKWKHWSPFPSTTVYCDRIVTVSKENPLLLIAYAHSMYMAILAGGQILRKIIQKTLRLKTDDGLAIFAFEGTSKAELKRQFIENINSLELTSHQQEQIVEEKIRVFKMNNEIASCIEIPFRSYTKVGAYILLILLLCGCVLFICLKIL